VILVGLTTGSLIVLGVACWQMARGRNVDLFRRAAALALVVAVPVTAVNLAVGSRFGITVTSDQSMKIAASEALWNSEKPAGFSLFQIGGFTQSDQKPSFVIQVPKLLSLLATGSLKSEVQGLNELQQQERKQHGEGNYLPSVVTAYWAMRVMAYVGTLMFLVAAVGAWLYRKRRLESARWYLWTAVVAMAFPFIAATAGWVLTEVGRQPWIVQGLLKTSAANSPNVSSAMIASSLGVFVALYIILGVADFVLMRRYARLDPPPVREDVAGEPVPSY
jgi:cytochrome d ubiquinol oxidase subunit I